MSYGHKPVLLQETLDLLALQPGDIVIDCTLGGGGHTLAIRERLGAKVKIIAIDQDEKAIAFASKNLPSDIIVVHDNFRNLKSIALACGLEKVNRILFDLGVSSPQLDEGERGFSYHQDAPLDMRMDRRRGRSARELINEMNVEELADIIYRFGEERWAKRIAQFIVEERESNGSIDTTSQLVDVIKRAIPAKVRQEGPHPARRTFQALRIAVNGELDVIEPALQEGISLLAPGGRMAVITFHSLEDRLVKQVFKQAEKGCTCPPRLPVCVCGQAALVTAVTRKPFTASADEVRDNPRARSAKLRVVERL